jgi:hypothetical protein
LLRCNLAAEQNGWVVYLAYLLICYKDTEK